MIEAIILILFTSLGVLPCVFSQSSCSYKENWIMGNVIAGALIVMMLVLVMVILSIDYIFFDGIGLQEHFIKILNNFNN